jgi:tetratricopeptide (TPR) repeat protein
VAAVLVSGLLRQSQRSYESSHLEGFVALSERARDACLRVLEAEPGHEWFLGRLTMVLNNLGQVHAAAGRHDLAYAAFRLRATALRDLHRATGEPECLRSLAITQKRLMEASLACQDFGAAVGHYNEYADHFHRAARERPDDVRGQVDSALATAAAAELFAGMGQADEAASFRDEAAGRMASLIPRLPLSDGSLCDDVVRRFVEFTQAALAAGRFADAQRYLGHANQVRQKLGQSALAIERR